MTSRDWYEKALGRPTAPLYQPAPYPQPQPAPAYQPTQPAQQGYVQPGQFGTAPIGQVSAHDAIRMWRGSAGGQTGGACPRCGSANYLARVPSVSESSQGVDSTRTIAAGTGRIGHCFECGYRQMDRYDIAGPMSGVGLPSTRTDGPPVRAFGPSMDVYSSGVPRATAINGRPTSLAHMGSG